MRTASNAAIYRPDLGMSVMEFWEGPGMGFIGTEILPIFPTPKASSTYPVIPKEALLKIPDTSRAPRGNYQRGDWTYERGLYSTSEQGWEEPIDDDERDIFDQESPGAADLIATKRGLGHILRGQEKRIADMVFNSTNFTAHAVSDEWDDADNAVPITNVNTGKLALRDQCGMLPDALVIAYSTFVNLKNCAQVVDRLKYTFPGIDINKMTSQELAQIFDVPRVLVGGAVYDSAKQGASASIADVWSNEFAALIKMAQPGDIVLPGLGVSFLWTADSAENPIVEQYREEGIRSDVFRVRHSVAESFMQSKNSSGTVVSDIAAACMYLFSNITT